MRNRIKFITSLVGVFAFIISGQVQILAQSEAAEGGGAQIIEPSEDTQGSEFVTINVKNANIAEVLKAYSLQTGQSIVVGPDVVSENVNVRLNNIPWEEALDVILKPYGFGYRIVGDTIVISKLENIVTVEGIEPLASRVFNLKYLDAYDIRELCEAQLTSRGKFTILSKKGLPGWSFSGDNSSQATSGAGVRKRAEKTEIHKSKVFLITDVPAAITDISKIIEELDQMPGQILIEATFMEVDVDNLSDVGIEFLTAIENVSGPLLGAATLPAVDGGGNVLNPIQAATDSIDAGASGMFNQNQGLRLTQSTLGDWGADMLIRLQNEDEDINILSAPHVLTLDSQEAAILVGQKYPIIESDTTGSVVAQTSISLDYYENIGIQLNVLPQISNGEFINMIVHPVVSEIKGFTSGSVELLATDTSATTRYPILNVREAETQILLKSEETAVIGGLQSQRESFEVQKVPWLGDIPFVGRLFRREIEVTKEIDLLIFIKASIIDREAYAAESLKRKAAQESSMKLINSDADEEAATEEDATEAAAAEEDEAAAEEGEDATDDVVAEEGEAAAEEAAVDAAVPAEEAEVEEAAPAEESPDAGEAAEVELTGSDEVVDLVNSMDSAAEEDVDAASASTNELDSLVVE